MSFRLNPFNPENFTVVIVDDNDNNRYAIAKILENAGYRVIESTSGSHAIQIAEEKKPDAIILDVMMPGMDGFEVCHHLKSNPSCSDIPVIFLTARDNDESIEKGFEAGGADYVVKPVHVRTLLARLKSHIERSLSLRQLEQVNHELEKMNQCLDKQIQNNLSVQATLNDQVRNPLSIAITLVEMGGCERGDEVIRELMRIDSVIDRLDNGFLQSEKIHAYLKKHHGVT